MQSLMPAILAVVLAIGAEGFNLALAILSCLGVACAHLGMNLADDYFDYKADMLSDRDRVIRKGFRAIPIFRTAARPCVRSDARLQPSLPRPSPAER